jgi:hypothetical protein
VFVYINLSFVWLLSKTPNTKACKVGILPLLCIITLIVTKKEDRDVMTVDKI